MSSTKIKIGILIVALISASVTYVTFFEDAKIRVDADKTTFYVKNENNAWIVAAREYNKIFDGSSQMNRDVSYIKVETIIDDVANTVTIKRTTPYKREPIIIDTYYFDGKINSIERFPISHKIEILNGSGYFYRYEVRDLKYTGITYKLSGLRT